MQNAIQLTPPSLPNWSLSFLIFYPLSLVQFSWNLESGLLFTFSALRSNTKKMLYHSLSKPSISIPIPNGHPPSSSPFAFRVRCAESSVDSQSKTSPSVPPPLSATKLMESEASAKTGPYPGGTMGPYTGRDPNVKKPGWLRQRAPQGQRFDQVKESLSRLNLNTVCEEAQCPNIGEVSSFSPFILFLLFGCFNLVTDYSKILCISLTLSLELRIYTCNEPVIEGKKLVFFRENPGAGVDKIGIKKLT